MTDKQRSILNVALDFFATKGFDGVSTNAIAKEAGVSEGLIFRHFKNKAGLLDAIIDFGITRATAYFKPVLEAKTPQEVIHRAIEVPFKIPSEEQNYWKLIYALKFQEEEYDDRFIAPLHNALTKAFAELGEKEPENQARVIRMFIDGSAMEITVRKGENLMNLAELLKEKYTY